AVMAASTHFRAIVWYVRATSSYSANLTRSGWRMFAWWKSSEAMLALVSVTVKFWTSAPTPLAALSWGAQNLNTALVMFSLVTSMLKRIGVAWSSSLVKTHGLCMRLPEGLPLAASRGLTMAWETAITAIDASRPFWVTPPFTWPDFCPTR